MVAPVKGASSAECLPPFAADGLAPLELRVAQGEVFVWTPVLLGSHLVKHEGYG